MSNYGVFIYTEKDGWCRPKSKAEIRQTTPERISLEGITPFDNLIPDGKTRSINDLPDGKYDIVGPDPYNSRKFYGSIVIAENGQIYVK